ncbi:hypothetical protein [Pseudomonas amygdali]|uniref:hypothetical protein n=1 Tax=Pseudomonas amygdali TaxID=47877 RepID=UPI0016795637|nr:hypothetical protein [Pseudomonas amygdali]
MTTESKEEILPLFFFTNEDPYSDEDYPERQYISLRTEEGKECKIQLNVLPDFTAPNAIDAERFKFVSENIVEEFTDHGNSVSFENEEYQLKLSIQYDNPAPSCEKAIAQRFQ